MPASVPSSMQSEDHVVVAGGPAAVVGAPDIGQSPRCGREVVESGNGSPGAGAGAPNTTSTIGSVREVPVRSGGLLLDGLDTGLNLLKNGGAAIPLPYVKETAGVLLQILNSIQAVRDNQDAFNRLVDQAGRILFSITREVEPREITGQMEFALKKIKNIVDEIKELSDKKTQRGKVRRFFGTGSDKVEIARLRDELNVAIQIFGVDATVINNADIRQLTEYVKQLMDRHCHAGTTGGPPSAPPSTSTTHSSLPTQPQEATNRGPASNMSNCHNVTITTTSNSYNNHSRKYIIRERRSRRV